VKQEDTIGTTQSRKRQEQIDAGIYDGRYATKVVEDKKKKMAKVSCRKFKFQNQIED
jgi:hypothetical protein